MQVTLGQVLQFLAGAGLLTGTWKAGGAIRDFRRAVADIALVLSDHIDHHPPATEETTNNVPASIRRGA